MKEGIVGRTRSPSLECCCVCVFVCSMPACRVADLGLAVAVRFSRGCICAPPAHVPRARTRRAPRTRAGWGALDARIEARCSRCVGSALQVSEKKVLTRMIALTLPTTQPASCLSAPKQHSMHTSRGRCGSFALPCRQRTHIKREGGQGTITEVIRSPLSANDVPDLDARPSSGIFISH